MKRCSLLIALLVVLCLSTFAQNPSADSTIVSRVGAATVVILTGEGAGRLSSISTGTIVRADGVILTAYHSIKDVREVQVRLRSGDVFDQVSLIGVDERRDVAALKISARELPTLAVASVADVKAGDVAYVVANSGGLGWTASKGIFAALRSAEEVPGAGHGYRVLQFTGPINTGASGGPVVDLRGNLVGIFTKGSPNAETAFAVPIESVMGLADGTQSVMLGSGSALQMPVNRPTPSSAALANANPKEILRAAKTLHVATRSVYFTPETLQKELAKQKNFQNLRLMVVTDPKLADLQITVDRPLFTYAFTYSVTDLKTSILLDSGKVTAIDGGVAAGKIAKQLVEKWTIGRKPEPSSEGK
jgi:hypothetical protein